MDAVALSALLPALGTYTPRPVSAPRRARRVAPAPMTAAEDRAAWIAGQCAGGRRVQLTILDTVGPVAGALVDAGACMGTWERWTQGRPFLSMGHGGRYVLAGTRTHAARLAFWQAAREEPEALGDAVDVYASELAGLHVDRPGTLAAADLDTVIEGLRRLRLRDRIEAAAVAAVVARADAARRTLPNGSPMPRTFAEGELAQLSADLCALDLEVVTLGTIEAVDMAGPGDLVMVDPGGSRWHRSSHVQAIEALDRAHRRGAAFRYFVPNGCTSILGPTGAAATRTSEPWGTLWALDAGKERAPRGAMKH